MQELSRKGKGEWFPLQYNLNEEDMPEATMRTFEFMPLNIRLDTLGGLATPLVLRGTPLPTSRSDVFNTAADNQSSVLVNLVMGESPLTSNDIPLGKVLLQGIPPAPKGQRQIKV